MSRRKFCIIYHLSTSTRPMTACNEVGGTDLATCSIKYILHSGWRAFRGTREFRWHRGTKPWADAVDCWIELGSSKCSERKMFGAHAVKFAEFGDYWSRLGRWQSEKERWILICSGKPHALLSADWALCLRGRGIKPIVTCFLFFSLVCLRASSAPQCTFIPRFWRPKAALKASLCELRFNGLFFSSAAESASQISGSWRQRNYVTIRVLDCNFALRFGSLELRLKDMA